MEKSKVMRHQNGQNLTDKALAAAVEFANGVLTCNHKPIQEVL